MYDDAGPFRSAARRTEPLPTPDPGAAARLALDRVRNLLTAFLPGMAADPARLTQAVALAESESAERSFALGWLAWLGGNWEEADGILMEARQRSEGSELLATCAYWSARVRILVGGPGAVSEFEAVMKRLGGSPQATAWYVDLLARAGRVDRADQVWKSVRANKRVAGCDEGPLLDARFALRRGELGSAEKLLREMTPKSGVVQAERQLLLAWAFAGSRKPEAASEALGRAASSPYPARVLAEWRKVIEARSWGEIRQVTLAGWDEYLAGQAARKRGDLAAALAHYRAAAQFSATQPYATYALACVGEAEPQAALAAMPGAYFAPRARLRAAVERFRRREGGPGEFLEALDQATRAGVETAPFEAFRTLARMLQTRLGSSALATAKTGNELRVALEHASRLPAEEAAPLLTRWLPLVEGDLREAVARQLVRCALRLRAPAWLPPDAPDAVRELLSVPADGSARPVTTTSNSPSVDQSIRLVEAAQRGDVEAVILLLGDAAAWRAFPSGPPRFVVRALAALLVAKAHPPALLKSLTNWCTMWKPGSLGPAGAALTGAADAVAPAGVDADSWFRHQAARALLRDDPTLALTMLQRTAVKLPAVERLALAQTLGRAYHGQTPALLMDMVELLKAIPGGDAVLGRPPSEAREALAVLAERPEVPGRLLHHVALLESRLARFYEMTDASLATLHGRRAWAAWLGFLASPDAPPTDSRRALLEHLISCHKQRVNDHLARNEHEPARSHWQLVMQLPILVRYRAPLLAEEVKSLINSFRDELATECLLVMREAMRFGDIPEGWRANYERGLSSLESLLAIDEDNARLLTALVETCGDWFLDLYNLQDRRLFTEVERYAAFADRLAERSDGTEAAARPALSVYWKFRGFCASGRREKLSLYRKALVLDPGNDNVRTLIADLGDDDE